MQERSRTKPSAPRSLERDSKPEERKVPPTVTADELQEIISQAIWEWGVRTGCIPKGQRRLSEQVLETCFQSMVNTHDFGGEGSDYGGASQQPMTSSAKKISRLEFCDGVKYLLGLNVAWANMDILLNRMIAQYPVSPTKPKKQFDEDDDDDDNLSYSSYARPTRSSKNKSRNPDQLEPWKIGGKNRSPAKSPAKSPKADDSKAEGSHVHLSQFIAAFTPPHNTEEKNLVLDSRSRGSSTKWMDTAFGKVMDAMDRDNLLLHEAFMVFDITGDGVISVGEFIRILKRMEPPLEVDRSAMFSMFTAMNANGVDRKIKPTDFVDFFTKLYQQRSAVLWRVKDKVERDVTHMEAEIAAETRTSVRNDLLRQKRSHVKLLTRIKAMVSGSRLKLESRKRFLSHCCMVS